MLTESNIHKISPHYTIDDYKSGRVTDIEVFIDQMKGWSLEHARILAYYGNEHCGFVVLQILFSYFETIEQYIKGERSNGESERFFIDGFKNVFPEADDKIAKIFYKEGRCGLFHENMVRPKIFLRDGNYKYSYDEKLDRVYIDRRKFTDAVIEHFDNYAKELENKNSIEYKNFQKFISG